MKTYYFPQNRLSIYFILGLLSFLFFSCSAYQNSSYYDSDGIYANTGNSQKETPNKNHSQYNKYQEYFSNLDKEVNKSEILTDVNSYSTTVNDSITNNTQGNYNNNAGWGSNPQSVNVNVYDSGWGWNYWNNYWYGGYWGWYGWYAPYWGWYGWYTPYWGYSGYYGWCGSYYNNYYYGYPGGRRGNVYGSGGYTASVNSTRGNYTANANARGNTGFYNNYRTNYNTRGADKSYTSTLRNETFSNTRNNNFNTRNNNFNTSTRSNNNYNQANNQNNSNYTRGNVRSAVNSTMPRSNTPNSNYSGGSSRPVYNGNSGSGFGGGGRSSGGGFGGSGSSGGGFGGGGRSGGGGRR